MLVLYFLNELNGSSMNPVQFIYLLYTCISDRKYYYNDIDVILDEVLQLLDCYEANVIKTAGYILISSKHRMEGRVI